MPEFSLADQLKGLSRTQKGGVIPETKRGEEPLFRVTKCTFEYSSKKGTPGWTYEAVILDEGEFQGEKLSGTAYFTAKGASMFLMQMEAFGISEEDMSETEDHPAPTNEQIAQMIDGAIFKGQIKVDQQQGGRPRNQLIAVEPGDSSGGFETLEGGEDDFGGLDEFASVAASDGADDPAIPDPDGTAGAEVASLPVADDADADDPWNENARV